jgi:hypothetical protein
MSLIDLLENDEFLILRRVYLNFKDMQRDNESYFIVQIHSYEVLLFLYSMSKWQKTDEKKLPQRPGLSQDEVSELYEAFKLFDDNSTGILPLCS